MSDLGARVRVAARRAYETHGPAAVSARKLAEQLGVSQMAMYRHYSSKEDLLRAVVEEGFAELTAAIREADAITEPVERLEARALQWLAFAVEHPRLFELMFTLPRPDARRYPDDFAARRSPTGVLIEADIREAMDSGTIPAGDPLVVGMMMWGMMHGLIMLQLGGRISLSKRDLHALYRASIRRVLIGELDLRPQRARGRAR